MKKEKQKWKMWAVQYKTTPYFIPIRFFSTRKEATAFAADHMLVISLSLQLNQYYTLQTAF